MTPILATVVNTDRQGGEYLVAVHVGSEKYPGTFDKLAFENKPDVGWYHYGWLELVYHRDPNLKAGQLFPLWSLQ
jgi:hypothetical protein